VRCGAPPSGLAGPSRERRARGDGLGAGWALNKGVQPRWEAAAQGKAGAWAKGAAPGRGTGSLLGSGEADRDREVVVLPYSVLPQPLRHGRRVRQGRFGLDVWIGCSELCPC